MASGKFALWVVLGLALAGASGALLLYVLWQSRQATPILEGPTNGNTGREAEGSQPAPFNFVDAAESLGIDFKHERGVGGQRYYPTANGSGVAILDYDNDGWCDLLFVNGGTLQAGGVPPRRAALYRQVGGAFVPARQGLPDLSLAGYGQGAAAGDFDNDGFADLYLTAYGDAALLGNNGDGTFARRSAAASVHGWTTSAVFFDYDRDGILDLYVCQYGRWSVAQHQACQDGATGRPVYCSALTIPPARHFLLKGDGAGGFVDATRNAGVYREDGRGLGVIAADLNQDGALDLFVANDLCPNFVFLNRKDGSFSDDTLTSGAAFTVAGNLISGMGVDAGDVLGQGDAQLFVTNFRRQYNVLFARRGDAFMDVTPSTALAGDSLPYVGWGNGSSRDFDNDGRLDVLVVNGELDENQTLGGQSVSLAQPSQLWHNEGAGRFRETGASSGSFFSALRCARGAAFGDLDNDGRCDLVVNNWGGRADIGLNRGATHGRHWLRLSLIGRLSQRDAAGTALEVRVGDNRKTVPINAGGSYLASNDPRCLIGLGSDAMVDELTIRWPSGAIDQLHAIAAEQDLLLLENFWPAGPTKGSANQGIIQP